VVPVLTHKGLEWKLPSSTSCRNGTTGSCGVYPTEAVGVEIVPVLQTYVETKNKD